MSVDPALAKRGATLFITRSCYSCHSIGRGRRGGPDLQGVTDRRTKEWLRQWLKDPTMMFGSDPVADAMLAENKMVKMPNMHLSDGDIEALTNYLAENRPD
jgi:protein SCO1/2